MTTVFAIVIGVGLMSFTFVYGVMVDAEHDERAAARRRDTLEIHICLLERWYDTTYEDEPLDRSIRMPPGLDP